MAADHYHISRTLAAFEKDKTAEKAAVSFKKLLQLQKRINNSVQHYERRAKSIPLCGFRLIYLSVQKK